MALTNFPNGIAAPGVANAVISVPLNLAQTGTKTIFTVSGQPILVRAIFGIVTTAVQAQANATKLQVVCTGLSAVDICATGDINGLTVGNLLMPITSFATALPVNLANGVGVAITPTSFVMNAGVIRLNCAASNTGQVQWYISYTGLDATGASTVVAASS